MMLNKLLTTPRQRHYLLGHEAFKQFAEADPQQFFALMASDSRQAFIQELIANIEKSCPMDDTILDPETLVIETRKLKNHPLLLIKMPPVAAYVECLYVGILLLNDATDSAQTVNPPIAYYTFEIGEGEEGDCGLFCQWQGETHYNLAELSLETTLDEFEMVIGQRLESGGTANPEEVLH